MIHKQIEDQLHRIKSYSLGDQTWTYSAFGMYSNSFTFFTLQSYSKID